VKKIIFIIIAISVIAVSLGCKNTGKVKLKDREDSLSYALGLQIGQAMEKTMTKVDYKMFVRAMQDAADTSKVALSNADIQNIMMTYQVESQMRMDKKRQDDSKKNQELAKKFLSENAKKPGVVSIDGIQYKIITEGKGPKPTANDKVEVKFVGKTFEGKEFMNSKDAPEAIVVGLGEVFEGWKVALPKMTEGSKWQIFLPDSLAFGDRGVGDVAPGQGVIFDLELVKVIKGR